MSAFAGNQPAWLPEEESKYADDFVEEEDSFLVLPTRREQVDNVEAELASAGNEPRASLKSTNSPHNSGHAGNSNGWEPAVSHEKNPSIPQNQPPSSAAGSVEQPIPAQRTSIPGLPSQMINSRTGGIETPSLISVVSSVSSSETSLDETNMMMSQLNLQSCKEKMAQMTESATKNLEAYKELQSSISALREEHQKKYEECGETIRTLRSENQALKDELSEAKSVMQKQSVQHENDIVEIEKLEVQITANEMDLSRTKQQLQEQFSKLQEANARNNELNEIIRVQEIQMQRVKQNETGMCSLQEERNVLNDAWEASKITVAQLKDIKSKQEERINQLEQEVNNVKALNDKYKQHGLTNNDNVAKLKSALDEAGNRLRQFQSTVAEKDIDITNLQTRMAALTSENEQKEIWKHQMEEYKSNFEDERRDRMAMRERLELLTQELAQAQEQLEKKTTDLESLHRTHLQLANEHVNREPTSISSEAGSTGSQNSLPHAAATLTKKISNMFQSVFPSHLWDEDANVSRENATPTGENNGAAGDGNASHVSSSPPPSIPTLGPQTPPPCPLCSKKFKSVASLERHAANCGIEVAATRTDPFVFP